MRMRVSGLLHSRKEYTTMIAHFELLTPVIPQP